MNVRDSTFEVMRRLGMTRIFGNPGSTEVAFLTDLPSDLEFDEDFTAEFGSAPSDFSDLYFDATTLLLRRLRQTSRLDGGRLVIDRSALATAVRNTRYFRGVSCRVTLDSSGNRTDDPMALSHCAAG